MGRALVTIVKEIEGKEFANTHGVYVGNDDTPVSNADLLTLGAGAPFTDATTDPASGGYAGEELLLHAIIGFERSMVFQPVNFVRLEVTDGAPNASGNTVFLSQTLAFAGLRPVTGGTEAMAPGTIALQVNREPANFSQRRGRIFFRGALLDIHVRLGGQTLVRFTDDDAIEAFQNLLNGSVSLSRLSTYFAAGASFGTAAYGIPNYGPKDTPTENQLVGVTPVANLTIRQPVSRQATRGRREESAAVLAQRAARKGNEAMRARILEAARMLADSEGGGA